MVRVDPSQTSLVENQGVSSGPGADDPVISPPKALIFDCDGTLLDTETLYRNSFMMAVKFFRDNSDALAGVPPSMTEDQWGAECSGRGGDYMSLYAVQKFNLDCSAKEFYTKWGEYSTSAFQKPIPLMPGFDELYAAARKKGLKVAVASSSNGQRLRMKLANGVVANSKILEDVEDFDVVVSNDDVTRHKPDPEIYLLAARRLGLAPEDCWVIEDTTTGVLAGKNAGMRVHAVPNKYSAKLDFGKADVVLESMAEMVRLIQ